MSSDLTPILEASLDPDIMALARLVGRIAVNEGMAAYLVGGPVRDLLMERSIQDVDFTVEGDAGIVGGRLAVAGGGHVAMRSQFLTIKVRVDGRTVDLVTARREWYPVPGSLPEVEASSVEHDLLRRDFTINAMAVALHPERFGRLLDPRGGAADIERKLVRVLHPDSFRDDATRILRGIRYEQRLGFALEQDTEALIRRDVSFLGTISPDRLRHELERVLDEPAPERVLWRAQELGVLAALGPGLRWSSRLGQAAVRLQEEGRASRLVQLALIAYPLSDDACRALASRINAPGEERRILLEMPRLRRVLEQLQAREVVPSRVYELLAPFRADTVRVALALENRPRVTERLNCYLERLRHAAPELRGEDILAYGVSPGPQVGDFLRRLHRARLDGEVSSREEEKKLVLRWLAEA